MKALHSISSYITQHIEKRKQENKLNKEKKPSDANIASGEKNYFVQAKSWADDMYTSAIISRNRYKLAFYCMLGLAILLALSINSLIPLQKVQPLLINHYQDGRVSVKAVDSTFMSNDKNETQSELVRYVVNRESFDPISYDTQYSLINLLSSNDVADQYMNDQSSNNKYSPINILGNKGYRTVHVDNVIFLDSTEKNKGKPAKKQTHHNLAQIDFTITDHMKNSGVTKTTPLTALISWGYRAMSDNPNDRWRDWNGFTITRYTVEQRNL